MRRNASSLRMAEAGATANAAQSSLNNQLHDAAALGDVAALREALAAGADVDARRAGGISRTPLARVVNPSLTISDERRTACVRPTLSWRIALSAHNK